MGEEGGGLFMVNSVGTSAVREKTVFQASFKKKHFFLIIVSIFSLMNAFFHTQLNPRLCPRFDAVESSSILVQSIPGVPLLATTPAVRTK